MAINICLLLRLVIGGVFVVSGFEKLVGSYQNFLYVVQGYQLFGPFLEEVAARIMPWAEFLLGVFLMLGLWFKWVTRAMLAMTAAFIIVVAQALVRGLSIAECGCFGDIVSIPLPAILLFDTIMLFVIDFLIYREERAGVFGLDRYYKNQP